MKRKVIIVTLVILALVVAFLVGFILVNLSTKKEETTNENETIQKQEEVEEVKKEEKQSVALDSKIGTKILSKLMFPNIYSKTLFEELDKNGVTGDFKVMYTFSLITSYQNYSNYLREGQDYVGNYITKDDLEKVAKTIFYDTSNLKHQNVFDQGTYNAEKENYVIVAKGYLGSNVDYVIEVPYEIYEYNDKVEVNAYKLYVSREFDLEDLTKTPTDNIYYDENMQNLALKVSDEKMLDEVDGQKEFINEKIKSQEILKSNLKTVTWTFKKQEVDYLIVDYKNN